VWRDLAAAQGLSTGEMSTLQRLVERALETLCHFLASPFHVPEGPEHHTAVREAAERCACAIATSHAYNLACAAVRDFTG